MIKKLSLLFAMLFFTGSLAQAGTVTLAWNQNSEEDLAGYKLYYGNTSRGYTQSVVINDKGASTWALSLEPGVYYLALTAVDMSGNESGFSQELIAEIPSAEPPGKPGQPRLVP